MILIITTVTSIMKLNRSAEKLVRFSWLSWLAHCVATILLYIYNCIHYENSDFVKVGFVKFVDQKILENLKNYG